jgi:hypothetical protein
MSRTSFVSFVQKAYNLDKKYKRYKKHERYKKYKSYKRYKYKEQAPSACHCPLGWATSQSLNDCHQGKPVVAPV